jgi:hypothetical protein
LDLEQRADAADAGDQQASRGAALDAERRTRADTVARVTLNTDDLVIRNLDAKLMASLAAVQPEPVWVELEPTMESDAAVAPKDRVTRHARIVVPMRRHGIRRNPQSVGEQ